MIPINTVYRSVLLSNYSAGNKIPPFPWIRHWDYFADEATDTEYFLVYTAEAVFVVFRGTEGPFGKSTDWRANFDILKEADPVVPYEGTNRRIRIHGGILRKYKNDARRHLLEMYRSAPQERFVFTGHSQGGAIAAIAARDFHYHYGSSRTAEAYLFGVPRTYNNAGAHEFNHCGLTTLNFQFGSDIVPMLPPRILGFDHVGTIVKLGEPPWYRFFSVDDHYPNHYVNSIKRLLPATYVV